MGQTKVDLHHLLEDLRDAYPGSPEETILTEVIANSLDSGASAVAIATHPAASTLTVVDNGSGMQRRALARYHDIASSTKARGEGIGFAGVGIKLGLLLSHEVYTETRRGSTHVATRWRLSSRQKAPWTWVAPQGFVPERGTAVQLRVTNVLSPLLDPGFVELVLRRHFEPLFDPSFDAILSPHYRRTIRFELNGALLARTVALPPGRDQEEAAPVEIKLARRRKPSAVGRLLRHATPLPEDDRGVAVSTLGKVIKRGWDWLGVSPATPDRISGLIEAPELAACLTLNKSDFIRTGSRGLAYLAYRKAIQEVVSKQLALWGDTKDSAEEARRRVARPVERDLERVLIDLAPDFPLLAALVERRMGGQRKLPIGKRSDDGKPLALLPASVTAGEGRGDGSDDAVTPESTNGEIATPPAPPERPPSQEPERPPSLTDLPASQGPKRPQRYGLAIQFESRPHDAELGRLVDSTVWVNDAHPAYVRAAASRSEGYHLALTVAMSLAPLAVVAQEEHAFVTAFLVKWGESMAAKGRARKAVSAG